MVFDCDINAKLREVLTELRDERVLLMGDFNYPGVDWLGGNHGGGASPEGVLFAECLEDNFYEQFVKEPTRGGNILDLVITNEQGLMGELSVEAGLGSSDHGLVKWNIYVGVERREDSRESRDYKRADFDGMRAELRSVDWVGLLKGDVEEDWTCFKDLLRDLERRFVPVRKSGGPRKAVWMTYKARKAVMNKRKVFAKHKDGGHPRCVEANKRASREVRSAKFNYEKKLAENVKYDAKSFYAYVRSRSKSRSGIGVVTREDGGRVETPEEVAEEFNEYFSSVFSREDLGSIPGGLGEVAGGGGAIWRCRVRRSESCWESLGPTKPQGWTSCPQDCLCISRMRSLLRYA